MTYSPEQILSDLTTGDYLSRNRRFRICHPQFYPQILWISDELQTVQLLRDKFKGFDEKFNVYTNSLVLASVAPFAL